MSGIKFSLFLIFLIAGANLQPIRERINKLLIKHEGSMSLPIFELCTESFKDEPLQDKNIDPKIFKHMTGNMFSVKSDIDYLGSGAFGTVFKTKYGSAPAAVKIIKNNLENLDSLAKETYFWMKMWSKYSEDVIEFYECVYDAKYIYLIQGLMQSDMYFFAEQTFRTSLLNDVDRLWIAYRMTQEIQHMHELKIIHFDLKPENFMISKLSPYSANYNKNRAYDVRIIDFGFASPDNTSRFWSGSPLFMAPEVWNDEYTSTKSDVYSLGVTIWNLFSPKIFQDNFCMKFKRYDTICNSDLLKLLNETFRRPYSLAKNYPQVGKILEKMLSYESNKRSDLSEISELFKAELVKISPNFFPTPDGGNTPRGNSGEVKNTPTKTEAKTEVKTEVKTKTETKTEAKTEAKTETKTETEAKPNKTTETPKQPVETVQTKVDAGKDTKPYEYIPKRYYGYRYKGAADIATNPTTKPAEKVYNKDEGERPFQQPQKAQTIQTSPTTQASQSTETTQASQTAKITGVAKVGEIVTDNFTKELPAVPRRLIYDNGKNTNTYKEIAARYLTPQTHHTPTEQLVKQDNSLVLKDKIEQKPVGEVKPVVQLRPVGDVKPVAETRPLVEQKTTVELKPIADKKVTVDPVQVPKKRIYSFGRY